MAPILWRIWLFILLKPVIGEVLQAIEVECDMGIVIGVRVDTESARSYYTFKGIPYAEPPLGIFRFKSPFGDFSWSGKRVGDWDAPRCPQLVDSKFVGHEDCLYLNVFSPRPSSESNYPVMVYIHGGDFLTGGADGYSPMPLMSRKVILVTLQYRLGAFGFLSAHDDVLPGNIGLKDQTMALRWVKDHIKNFGGDPNRITIFGSGSGGASVHYQILTPYAKGLFSRAIIQSGSAMCPRMLRKNHEFLANELLLKFDCRSVYAPKKISYSTHLINCLKDVPMEKITSAYTDFLEWSNFPVLNVPRIDGDYLPDDPAVLMKTGKYNKVDILVGYNQHEGSIVTSPMYRDPALIKAFKEDFMTVGSLTMGLDEEESPAFVAALVHHSYIKHKSIAEDEGANRLTQLYTDRLFGVCIHDMLDFYLEHLDEGERVYAYQLIHRGQRSFCDDDSTTFDNQWVCHGDDIQYLFDGAGGFPLLETEDDLRLQEIIVTAWTNFAAYGNPTPDNSLGFLWDSYSPGNPKLLELKPYPSITSKSNNKTRMFWHSLSIGMNKLLYPEVFGKFVDLDQHDDDDDDDDALEPVFKTALAEDEISAEESRRRSLVNSFLNRKQEIEPTDEFASRVYGKHRFSHIAIEDLIAASGLWSDKVYPINKPEDGSEHPLQPRSETGKENQQCPGNLASNVRNLYKDTILEVESAETCEKPLSPIDEKLSRDKDTTLKTDDIEDLSLYNMIEAGLLKANILLKGHNEAGKDEEIPYIVDNENLRLVIETYGEYVRDYLKGVKVSEDQLQSIKEEREVNSKKESMHEKNLDTILFYKPEVTPDKEFPNKRKINYGSIENLIKNDQTTKRSTPTLVPSGGK